MSYGHKILSIIIILSALSISNCRDREEIVTAQCSTPEADAALKEAEAALKQAEVPLSLDDPDLLMNLDSLLPEPENLRNSEKQRLFESAIEKFNIALDELNREFGEDSSCSVSDLALLHLHLGLVYTLDAISRLLISDDPPQTFIIKRVPDGLYEFNIDEDTRAKLDAAQQPEDYPLAFTANERQGIMDFFYLIDGAVVKPIDPNIQPQSSSVDRPPYSKYAIWHLQESIRLFGQYDPEIEGSIEDFNDQVEILRAEIQKNCISWGFTYQTQQ